MQSGSVRFSQCRALRYNAVVQSGSVRAEFSVTMQSGFSQVQSEQSSPLQCRAVQPGSLACRPTSSPPKQQQQQQPNKRTNNKTKTIACNKHTECNKRSPQTAGAQAPRCSQMIRLTWITYRHHIALGKTDRCQNETTRLHSDTVFLQTRLLLFLGKTAPYDGGLFSPPPTPPPPFLPPPSSLSFFSRRRKQSEIM